MRESYWIDTSKGADYPTVDAAIQTECVVVGGGITGITTAYLLGKLGKRCVVVDSGKIGSGTTGKNTGKVSFLHGITYSEIKQKYGIERAKAYYQANASALSFIEEIITKEKIECSFERVPGYVYTRDRKMLGKIVEEFEVAKALGIPCTLEKEINLPIAIEGALCFLDQAQFHPKAYIDQLTERAKILGVQIYENTPILNIKNESPYTLYTDKNHKIIAETVILCSHFPFYDYKTFFFTKLRPERSYIVQGEVTGTLHKGIYINIEEPRRSLRMIQQQDKTLVFIGGENHKVGQGGREEEHYKKLKRYGEEVFGIKKYHYEWSAEDYVTPDHLPYIGYVEEKNPSLYVATGFSKWGLTNGTVAAMLIADLIAGKKNTYEESFSIKSRKDMLTQDFWKENINVAKCYIKGKLEQVDKQMPEYADSAKVVLIEGKRYGVYKDENGDNYIVDNTCTHLGCELVWNGAEKSWDCPCHGSRFSYEGRVLEGPATMGLCEYGEEGNKVNPHLTRN